MTFYGFGQADSSVLRIVVSEVEEWKANEGETFKIKVGANGGSDLNYKFGFSSEQSSDMKMDGVGNFCWSVNFGSVSVFNSTRIVPITFFVHNESNESDSVVLEINVLNKLNSDDGEVGEMAINFPNQIGWNLLDEGDTLSFQLIAELKSKPIDNVSFYLRVIRERGLKLIH